MALVQYPGVYTCPLCMGEAAVHPTSEPRHSLTSFAEIVQKRCGTREVPVWGRSPHLTTKVARPSWYESDSDGGAQALEPGAR